MTDWVVPEINLLLCSRCGRCVRGCPTGAVEMGPDGPVVARPRDCIYCAVCDAVCPEAAIQCFYEIVWETEDSAAATGHEITKASIAEIRARHAEILKRIEEIARTLRAIRSPSLHASRRALEGVVAFLDRDLMPHVLEEDRFLYPAVNDLAKCHQHTMAAMRLDHQAITNGVATFKAQAARLLGLEPLQADAGQLERATADLLETAQNLAALVALHLDREDRVLLPLAEQRLPRPEAQSLAEELGSGDS